MNYPKKMIHLFLPQILIYFAHLTIAQPDFLYYFCMNQNGNYTNNSTYRSNLDTALSTITSNVNTTIYGFTNTSVGLNSDTANALALCRGDVDNITCGECVYDSTLKLREICPNQMEAIGWYDNCMLRYSNRSAILTTMEESPSFVMWNAANASGVEFIRDFRTLLDRLRYEAAGGSSLIKFATGNWTSSITIYGMMQCSPNILEIECDSCLDRAARDIPADTEGRLSGRVIRPSCIARFDTFPFFRETPPLSTPPSDFRESVEKLLQQLAVNWDFSAVELLIKSFMEERIMGEDDNTERTVMIIVVAIIILVFILAVGTWIFVSKRKKRKPNTLLDTIDMDDDISTLESLQYDLETIRTATDFFSDSNKLGQGGFGAVYKGRLHNGLEIAVKRLSEKSAQGELEFKNEVVLLAKLQHRNLVRLLGFCLQGIERLLIYEFVPNVSLDHFIFDPVNRVGLDWDRRYKIIGGVARGLLYLHEDSRLRIIHRDLKASNILLDNELNAKIADFGMARLCKRDETQGNTTRIVGTYGYMAPEYAMHGQFSVKSDVFSFGVLVLEIVSGQRNNCFRNGENIEDLLSYAWKNWQEQRVIDMVDPVLRSSTGTVPDIVKCIHIGLLCVQENIVDRPTMATVISMFNSESITLSMPSEPAFFMHGNKILGPEKPSLGESANASINDMSLSALYPR